MLPIRFWFSSLLRFFLPSSAFYFQFLFFFFSFSNHSFPRNSFSCLKFSLVYSSVSVDIGSMVGVESLTLTDYSNEKVYESVDKFLDPNHLPCNIRNVHCRASTQSFCNFTVDYVRCLKPFYCSAVVSTPGTTVAHQVDSKKVLKDDCPMFMLDGHYQCRIVGMIMDKDRLVFVLEPLSMQYPSHIDRRPRIPSQGIQLSTMANISTATIRHGTNFKDSTYSVLNFVWAFEEYYAMRFVYARVMDIVDDMMSFNCLAANAKAAHVRYVDFAEMVIKDKGVLPLLVSLAMDAPVVKTACITYLDD